MIDMLRNGKKIEMIEEIIAKVNVTPANEGDGKQLKGLLEGLKEFMEIQEILGNTAYPSKGNLKLIHG